MSLPDLPAAFWVTLALLVVAELAVINWVATRFPDRDFGNDLGEWARHVGAIVLCLGGFTVIAHLILAGVLLATLKPSP